MDIQNKLVKFYLIMMGKLFYQHPKKPLQLGNVMWDWHLLASRSRLEIVLIQVWILQEPHLRPSCPPVLTHHLLHMSLQSFHSNLRHLMVDKPEFELVLWILTAASFRCASLILCLFCFTFLTFPLCLLAASKTALSSQSHSYNKDITCKGSFISCMMHGTAE